MEDKKNLYDEKTLLPTRHITIVPTVQMEFSTEFWNLIPIALKPAYENFCQNVLLGQTGTEAYYNAFCKNGKEILRESCASKASKLLKRTDIQNRIRQLHSVRVKYFVMSDLEIQTELSKIATDITEDTTNRLTALKTLAQIKNMFKKDEDREISNFVDLKVNIVQSKNPLADKRENE